MHGVRCGGLGSIQPLCSLPPFPWDGGAVKRHDSAPRSIGNSGMIGMIARRPQEERASAVLDGVVHSLSTKPYDCNRLDTAECGLAQRPIAGWRQEKLRLERGFRRFATSATKRKYPRPERAVAKRCSASNQTTVELRVKLEK